MKTNEEKIKLFEKLSVICGFLWLISFIVWIVLTFLLNSNIGMWISLSFMWFFFLSTEVIKKVIRKKKKLKNDVESDEMIN